ncbi:hypothetical protein HI914_02434 [Erysiphe necator]|nr:hypothetical protein HI914_02434 [Erysiphe necator]
MLVPLNLEDNRYDNSDISMYPHQKLLSSGLKDHDKDHSNFDGNFIGYDMDCSLVSKPMCKSSLRIPVLPQRNALRTVTKPRKESVNARRISIENYKEFYNSSILRASDPHDVYLSSEEDVSVKDSNEDFLFDSDDSDKDYELKSYDRESHAVTAKAISFRAAGKPQIIEINNQSNNSSPRTSVSIPDFPSRRPLLPRLPALSLNLSEFHLDANELFPSSPHPLSPQKPAENLKSNTLANDNFYKNDSYPSPSKPISEPNTSLSIFRRGSLLSRRSQITQSILQMPTQATRNSATTASKISSRINALKHVTRNIKNAGMPKINLAYTPGVVPRRT